jgi:hypothetical protein
MVEERNLLSSSNDIASTNYRYTSIFTTSINRRLTTTVFLAIIGTCLVFFHGHPFSGPSHDVLLSSREEYIQQLLPVSLSRDTRLHRLSRQLLEKSADKTSAETLAETVTETSTEISKKTSKRASKGTSTYVDGHIPDQLMTVLRQRLLSANTSTSTTTNSTSTNTTSTDTISAANSNANTSINTNTTNTTSNDSTSTPPSSNPDPNPNPPTHRTLALANIRTYTVTVQNLIDSLAVANRCDVAVAGVGMAQCNLRSAWAYCAATLTAQVSACYCVTVLV